MRKVKFNKDNTEHNFESDGYFHRFTHDGAYALIESDCKMFVVSLYDFEFLTYPVTQPTILTKECKCKS